MPQATTEQSDQRPRVGSATHHTRSETDAALTTMAVITQAGPQTSSGMAYGRPTQVSESAASSSASRIAADCTTKVLRRSRRCQGCIRNGALRRGATRATKRSRLVIGG